MVVVVGGLVVVWCGEEMVVGVVCGGELDAVIVGVVYVWGG